MLVARALKNSQLTGGESHAYFGDRTIASDHVVRRRRRKRCAEYRPAGQRSGRRRGTKSEAANNWIWPDRRSRRREVLGGDTAAHERDCRQSEKVPLHAALNRTNSHVLKL